MGAMAVAAVFVGYRLIPPAPSYPSPEQVAAYEKSHWPNAPDCQPQALAKITPVKQQQLKSDACERDVDKYRQDQANHWYSFIEAASAQKAVGYARWQASISAITVSVLIITIAAAAWAAVEANRSANAATRTLDHEQGRAERELRAYVFVDQIKFKIFDEDEHSGELQVRVIYSNSGKTPAKNVKFSAKSQQIAARGSVDLTNLPGPRSIGPLGPKDERTQDVSIEVVFLTRDPKEAEVHAWGRIDYDDEFATGRWTTFHAYMPPDTFKRGKRLHTHDEGNDYR
jgi:hypothetical protein